MKTLHQVIKSHDVCDVCKILYVLYTFMWQKLQEVDVFMTLHSVFNTRITDNENIKFPSAIPTIQWIFICIFYEKLFKSLKTR